MIERLRNMLRHDNARVVAPPGTLLPGSGRPIVVATVQRSGTHVLIDLILNNLSPYRRRPVYIDLDQLLGPLDEASAVAEAQRVIEGGAYVLKTHHPALKSRPHLDAAFHAIAAASVVVTTSRDVAGTLSSLRRFVSGRAHAIDPSSIESESSLTREIERHREFWAPYSTQTIDFRQLFDTTVSAEVVQAIGELVDVEPRQPHRPAPPKSHRRRVMLAKAATRVIGHRSPVLNTTVGFDQGKPAAGPPASSR